MLAEVELQRNGGVLPPPPPPPVEDGWGGFTLNRDVLEERLSAPVELDAPDSAPSVAPAARTATRVYDEMLPLTPGAGGIRRPSANEEVVVATAAPYEGVRLLQLNGLERANLLLLLYLVAAGFGSSSPQLWDDGLLFELRLGASALVLGHALIAGYGFVLIRKAAGEGGEAPRLSAPAWALRLLLTGAGGLRTLREELR